MCIGALPGFSVILTQRNKIGKMLANIFSMQVAFTGKYLKIMENTGKYWKTEFFTLELEQIATLNIYVCVISIIAANALGTALVLLFTNRKEVPDGIFLVHDE